MGIPVKLVTTLNNIQLLDNEKNSLLIHEFYLYLRSVNTSESYQNQNIKALINMAKFLGNNLEFIQISKKEEILSFLNTKIKNKYAKLFFNANSLDDLIEKTNADYRREVNISFPYKFEGKYDDPHLLQKLTTAEEMSGIFNTLMIALRRIQGNNGLFMNEKIIDQRRERSERVADPVKSFLEEAVEEDSIESDFVTKIVLHDAYERFCRKYIISAKSIELFGKDIKKKRFEDKRKTINGDRKSAWTGIKLKPEFLLSREQIELPFSEVN